MIKSLKFILGLILIFSISTINARITEEKVDTATLYYAGGEYDKCIQLAEECYSIIPYKLHEESLQSKILAYGAMAIRAKSLNNIPVTKDESWKRLKWGMEACVGLDKWLKNTDLRPFNSTTYLTEYFDNMEIALGAYRSIADDVIEFSKTYEKMSWNWVKKAYDQTYKKRKEFSQNPVVQLHILSNALNYFGAKEKSYSKLPPELLNEYWENIDQLVALAEEEDEENYVSVLGNIFVSNLYNKFMAELYREKPDYSLALDVMLKARDFMLYAKGAKQYRDFLHTSWKNISNSLGSGEYCMEHFEGEVAEGMIFFPGDDLGRRRNYCFVFGKDFMEPKLWNRGFINDIENKGFYQILESFPDCKKVYATGSDYMALTDFTGIDNRIYRLHSLSDVINRTDENNISDFGFVGCVNFNSYDFEESSISEDPLTKGSVRSNLYNSFPTDNSLLQNLKSINIPNSNFLLQSEVTSQNLINLLKDKSFVHISTHGKFDNLSLSELNENLGLNVINGVNVFKNCKLLLSGYNDNNDSYLSAEDIRHMDLSNLKLLFLDACQTADGRRIGLGSFSLAEAFHLAGVKNIIATLDPVDPNVTHDFAIALYDKINKGESIHNAFYLSKAEICPATRIILWE